MSVWYIHVRIYSCRPEDRAKAEATAARPVNKTMQERQMCVYIYIERERDVYVCIFIYLFIYICIFIYIYIDVYNIWVKG